MAKKNASAVAETKKPTGTVTCPHCGSVVDLEACPTFNGQGSNGVFCSACRGPLTEDSVDPNIGFGLTKENNEAVREALREKVRDI